MAHIESVIGPDEYHVEVADNAYTNVMARWNLRRAAAWARAGKPGVGEDEIAGWLRLADALVDGYDPATGVYEQHAGFFDLEPLVIAEVAPRRPVSAEALLGHERVHGAQVVKQADALLLHLLVPDELAPGSLERNLDFYEPRTAHGSSLSPGVHAALLARAGRLDRALAALRLTSRIDLDDLTGTTAGGLHLAAMGSLWQAIVFGFAGIRLAGEGLAIDPRLPGSWDRLEVNLRLRGSRIRVELARRSVTVRAEPAVSVVIGGQRVTASPGGTTVALSRSC
jgi:trehalose/maltose hydrolase-like predicted phosphorylase